MDGGQRRAGAGEGVGGLAAGDVTAVRESDALLKRPHRSLRLRARVRLRVGPPAPPRPERRSCTQRAGAKRAHARCTPCPVRHASLTRGGLHVAGHLSQKPLLQDQNAPPPRLRRLRYERGVRVRLRDGSRLAATR